MNLKELATNVFDLKLEQKAGDLLTTRHSNQLKPNETILINARTGEEVVYMEALLGSLKQAHVFEFAVDGVKKEKFEETFSLIVDFFDGILNEFFAHERNAGLPLDFMKCDFEGTEIFARQEYRDFEVESLTEKFLSSHADKKNLKKE